MALATQCPHCQTTFRVVQDQLKLRAGLVRCGRCKQIFNGIEHLLPPDGTPASRDKEVEKGDRSSPVTAPPSAADNTSQHLSSPATAAEPPVSTDTAASADEDNASPSFNAAAAPSPASVMPTSRLAFVIPAHFEREQTAPVYHEGDPKPADPLQRMTLVDYQHDQPENFDDLDTASQAAAAQTHETDALDQAIDDLQRKPWRRTSDAHTEDHEQGDEEPDFVRQHRAQRQAHGALRTILIVGNCVLALLALLQAGYSFRNQLAGTFPQTKPMLSGMCQLLNCRIDLPANINAVSIVASELQAQDNDRNRFQLNVLLRNDSSLAQEWPALELTLNDAAERPLLRRVFTPSEYLSQDDLLQAGFIAMSEHSVRLAFELEDAPASGYRVYLFYP